MASSNTTSYSGLALGDNDLFTAVVNGSSVFDPASLTTYTGTASSAVTITGAAFGDYVLVSAPYDATGIIAVGCVSAANAVKITVFNATAGTIDLASGTWKIKLLKG
ncbi:hypothetical protein [Paenibacillus harenae]|uniref:hypothetical protein n=1 Tax=Paenibacillus harenae TaxID=306543 RepID=UPI00278D0C52|nr:hypothetical protein [Paenibacillus harenae]MDQ0062382.1 hypothetical protein [Paenibacillus harenae]